MPLIKFFGIPHGSSDGYCTRFKFSIKQAVAAIPEMKITIKDISVKLMAEVGGEDGEIHIEVTYNDVPERTPAVRRMLASVLTKTTNEFFPNLTLTECWGDPFDPKERGFSFIRN